MSGEFDIQGSCDPRFVRCADAFRANFCDGGELGAACAVFFEGKPVVDLWGGRAATDGEAWHRDTAAPVFSVTKGISALCILSQVSRGAIELDRPVAHYWPEFGVHGKDSVTVREALAHRAGVPLLGGEVTIDDLADPRTMAARLATEAPLFEPGSGHVYHALTIGWITSELMRRVTGQNVGAWFRDHLALPLDLNIRIGRDADITTPVATIEVPAIWDTPAIDPASIPARIIGLNGLFPASMSGLAAAMNDPAIQCVELAGANAVADARSLARLYSGAADGGAPLFIDAATLREACQTMSSGVPFGQDFLGPTWGAGLMLPWPIQPMLGPGSFGHDGAGGALAFAHAPSGVSFAYVRNRVGQPGIRDPMVYRVVDALAECLGISVREY
jgi:CubicO group peptidase (beta-lactamase class C family)